MNEPFPEPLTVWRLFRRYFVRIVIGTVLVAAVYGAISVYATHRREKWIASEMEKLGWRFQWEYCGPEWIPQSIYTRVPHWNRIVSLDISGDDVTDAQLVHLRGLTCLRDVEFYHIRITDSGMAHLKGLTNLETLFLYDTQVTKDGRTMLRKALPNCEIDLTTID